MGVRYVPTEEILQRIKDMAADGCTQSQIAALIGKDRSCVKRLLKDYHIQLEPSAKNRAGRKYEWSRNRIEKLKEFYASDQMSLQDIADYFETSVGTVNKYARSLGLEKVPKAFFQEEELEYLRKNAGKKTLKEMSEELGKNDWVISKQLNKMNIAVRLGKRVLAPETEEFERDIGNPALSHAALGRKYEVSSGTIKKWRDERFDSFQQMTDTYLCKSTSEMEFEEILRELNLSYLYEAKIDKWKVDYDLGFKFLVEIQGSYWHDRVEKNIKKDERKFKELQEKGYNILVIWDYDLKDKEKVKNQLLKCMKKCVNEYFAEVS